MTTIFAIPEPVVSTMADAAARSVVVLALAGVVVMCLRRNSAATRHLIWFTTMAGLLLLPILSVVLPHWEVLPSRLNIHSVGTFNESPQLRAGVPLPSRADFEVSPSAEVTGKAEEWLSPAKLAAPRFSKQVNWKLYVIVIWMAGTMFVLLPAVFGAMSLCLLGRSAHRMTAGPWVELLQQLTLNFKRKVNLMKSARRTMPMTWGLFRPRLLLPEEAEDWPEERRRMVLLHELAHVKRWDYLGNLVMQITCALYWFNPLVWVAARQMVAERERACDDLVLRAGVGPAEYAEELLRFAAKANRFAGAGAIAIARQSTLEGRLLAILDGKRNRAGTSRLVVLASVSVASLVIGVMATLRAAAANQAEPELPPKQNVVAALKGEWEFAPNVMMILASGGRNLFLNLEDGKSYGSKPADSPTAYLEKDEKGAWRFVITNIYNYRVERERATELWDTMSADEAAKPAGLAAVPFEQTGYYELRRGETPITVLLPQWGLLRIEALDDRTESVVIQYKRITKGAQPDPAAERPQKRRSAAEAARDQADADLDKVRLQQAEQELAKLKELQAEKARLRLQHAEQELARATRDHAQKLISQEELDLARANADLRKAELLGNQQEIYRIHLRKAEEELRRMTHLFSQQLVSEVEMDQARFNVELRKAELNGDRIAVARVRLAQVEAEFKRASDLKRAQLISEADYQQAQLALEISKAELAAMTGQSGSNFKTSEYLVQRGDTLTRIAHTNRVTVEALRKANPGVDWTKLQIGQKVVIP